MSEASLELLQRQFPGVEFYPPLIVLNAQVMVIDDPSRIDSFVKIEGGRGVHIGRHVHIASFAHLNIGGGSLVMEDHSCVASHGCIITGGDRPEGQSMSACSPANMQVLKANEVRIGRYAAVLTHATILPGVTLGEGAIAAAGAVVTRDIPPWEIWGGSPARFLAHRPRPWAPVPGLAPAPSLAQPGEPADGLTPTLRELDDDLRRVVPRPWEEGVHKTGPRAGHPRSAR